MADMSQPDLSAFGNLGALGKAGNPQELIAEMRASLARTAALRERVGGLVGKATSDDGHLRASYTGAGGLIQLTIDPRAMKLPSQEMAARIVRLTAAARADLERQRAEVVAGSGGDAAEVTRERSEAMLGELNTAYARSMGDIQTVFERFRRQSSG